jgi:hypothetical protein
VSGRALYLSGVPTKPFNIIVSADSTWIVVGGYWVQAAESCVFGQMNNNTSISTAECELVERVSKEPVVISLLGGEWIVITTPANSFLSVKKSATLRPVRYRKVKGHH